MRSLRLVALLLFLGACAGEPLDEPLTRQYGFLNAHLGNVSFRGRFAPDSVVALYDETTGSLQIEGNRHIGSTLETVRLQLICDAPPRAGSYAIAAPFYTPVSAGVFRSGHRWFPRRDLTFKFFVSDSVPRGRLDLDTLDFTRRRISGRFRTWVRTVNDKEADSMLVNGIFSGRLRTMNFVRARPVEWAPEMGRDCNAAKLL